MIDIRYCKRCKLVYNHGNGEFCSDCIIKIDDIMLKVRRYLDENPQASISEVSEGLQESEKDILFLLREGRLSIKSEEYRCLRCGKQMESGRYCTNCVNKMRTEFNGVVNNFKDNSNNLENNEYAPKDNSNFSKKGEMYTFYRRKDRT